MIDTSLGRKRCVAHEHHGKIVILDDGAVP
jgi:hypothetical protein